MSNNSEEALDFKQLLLNISNNWKWILGSLVVSLLIAIGYNRYAEPVYKAKAAILIKDEKKGGAGLLDNPLLKELDLNGGGKLLENEIEVLNSFDLMENVIRNEQLFINVRTKGSITSRTIYGKEVPFILNIKNPDTVSHSVDWEIHQKPVTGEWSLEYDSESTLSVTRGRWYIINGLQFQFVDNPLFKKADTDNIGGSYVVNVHPIKRTVSQYLGNLSISPASKNASIIEMEVFNTNERKAVSALTALIDIYNQQGLEDKNKVTANTLKFLNERLEIIEAELKGVEGQVQTFKSTNRITDVSAEAQQFLEQAKQIDQQKAQQQTDITILESIERELRNNPNQEVVSGAGIIKEPAVLELVQKLNNTVLEQKRQSERLGPKNPIPVDLANQAVTIRQNLLSNVSVLKNAYRIALNDLSSKDAELNSKIKNIPRIEKNLVQIQRDQAVKEQLYFLLLQKREEAAITEASTISDYRSVERPRSLGIEKPKKTLIYAVSVLLGLVLPIGVLYGVNFFNNKIQSKEEVELKSNASILGEISFIKKEKAPIVVQKASRSIIAEQFRVIRTNISFSKAGLAPKVIMVTSHRPEEGKSFTSLNLAASYAILNKRVIVLEFDLRKPRLSSTLQIKATQGISNFLTNTSVPLNECIKAIEGFEDNLYLLPAGPIPPSPAELILSHRMDELMEALRHQFDYIIIDTPPYSLVTDSSLIAKHADINVIVLRQGFSFKIVLDEINKKIADNPSQSFFTVINRVGEKNKYGSYKKYGYGYAEYFDK